MRRPATSLVLAVLLTLGALPALADAPSDLWTPEVMAKIRDGQTLGIELIPRTGYFEVFYDSEVGDASWADSEPPYEVHTGDTIRIHGYLAFPPVGGPYPALVLGHGHGGHGDLVAARIIAAFGYVVLSIDGPRAGESTGGPEDTEQAWISVERVMNEPSPEVGYLYHYAYAGMRGLTLLDQLSRSPGNPFRIDRTKLGVVGASMGGQFTYDRVASAGTDPRFIKRILFAANGSHPVVDGDRPLQSILEVLGTVIHWLRYAFGDGPTPPQTPTIQRQTFGNWFIFRVTAPPGSLPVSRVDLYFATQLDSTVTPACDFQRLPLFPGDGGYVGVLSRGFQPRCGPAVSADNLLFYASAKDDADYTVSSKMYHQFAPMEFCTGFVPRIGHFPDDDLPVPPPPAPDCACTPLARD